MSVPRFERDRPAEAVAGLIAAAAIFMSFIAIVYRPLRIAPFALGVALIAAGLGGRHSRLAAAAVAVSTACWVLGMTIAVLTGEPLY